MKLKPEVIKKIVDSALSARNVEIGCDDCSERLAEFAEHALRNRRLSDALQLVSDHLERCPDCREEFDALMSALRSIDDLG